MTFDTVSGRSASLGLNGVSRSGIHALSRLAGVSEAARGKRTLTVAELRELIDELARQEWMLLSQVPMRKMFGDHHSRCG